MNAQIGKMTGQPHVELSGLRKTYDGTHFVVEDLDLSIPKGEFLTLLGPSGSGKTTTLMMLAGFEHPTAGRIEVNGRSIAEMPPEKRNIGMVFQNYALFPHMTVAENVGYPLRVRRMPRSLADQKVRSILETVRLAQFSDRYPSALSGGQQQRVALARALVFEPEIVLMDEPLGALDKQLREELQLEIRSIAHALNHTVVYVTHDQQEALTMSDRAAIFNDGKIQQIAPAQEIYSRPVNRFVAEFMGDNNSLEATVTAKDGQTSVARLNNGDEIRALTTPHAELGRRVIISVRPEHVELMETAQPGAIRGDVQSVIYSGDHLRAQIGLASGDQITAKLPFSDTSADPVSGKPVWVTWRTEKARVLNM